MQNNQKKLSEIKTSRHKMALSLGVALTTSLVGGHAHAFQGNPTWQGNVSSDWNEGLNWSTGTAPTAGNTVFIKHDTAVVLGPVIDNETATTGTLYVGSQTNATLGVQNGGQLTSGSVIIGNSTSNAGLQDIDLEVGAINLVGLNSDNRASSLTADFLTIGLFGNGTLDISAGAQADVTAATTLGSHAGSEGRLEVGGANSNFTGKDLSIGASGKGVLSVTAGGQVESTNAALGINTGSTGTANLTGADAQWTITGALNVGQAGGGELIIANGAAVSAGGVVNIGASAAGGALSLSGADSSLTATGIVSIGTNGIGTATVSNGATLTAQNANGIFIGRFAGSNGTLNIGAAAGNPAAAAGHIDALGGIRFGQGSGRLVLNHTDTDYQLYAPISGNGAVDVYAGTTVFGGNSANYSGNLTIYGGKAVLAGTTAAASTTINDGGVLQIGNGGTTGSLNSNISNAGLLVFNRSNALTHNRDISGAGDVLVAGGVITFTGMNSYTGATDIASGATLALSNQGRVSTSSGVTVDGTFDVTAASSAQIKGLGGSGTVIVGNAGLQISNASQIFSGNITGNGGLNVTGGMLTLTGSSDFTNGLGISGGATVNIGGGGSTGSITSNVTNYGTVVFDRADDVTYAGNITGLGIITKAGENITTFSGSVAGTQINVEEGTAQFLSTVRGNANISAGALMQFANPGSMTYQGALSGTGAVQKSGTGTLTFSGDSSAFAGETTISAGTLLLTGALDGDIMIETDGTLQVGNGIINGSLLADTQNDGTLIFNQTSDYDYEGALSGSGDLIKQGAGTLILSGNYSYTGSTIVQAGLVQLNALLDVNTDIVMTDGTFDLSGQDQQVAGLSGTGGTLQLGASAFTVMQDEDSSFAGNITGTGELVKGGLGTLNLTGTNSFTGQVDINAGLLAVNGVLPGSIDVNNGGTLGGTGSVGNLIVRAGGTVAPGNSIGTLNVNGDILFEAGSLFEVEVDAAGNNDRINATGTATIEGANISVLAAAGNYRWISDYVILTAEEGVTGTFADPDIDPLLFLDTFLSYGSNDVTLTLVRNDRSFESVALTPNQQGVAVALDASNPLGGLYRSVAGQVDEAGAVQAFDALSGELWATTGTLMVDRTRRIGEMVIGRMGQTDTISQTLSNSGSAARETAGGRTGIWGQALGSWNRVKSDGNASGASQSSYGFLTGIDTAIGDWRLGLAFGHGEDKVQLDRRGNQAKVTGSTIAAYGGSGWGNLRARLGASYGWMDVKGTRNVAFPGFAEDVAANYDGKAASAFAELSYAASLGKALIEPFAGVNHVRVKTDGFAESGGELSQLTVDSQKRDLTYTTLGLRMGMAIPVSSQAVITPRVSAAWLRGFGDLAADGRHRLATGETFSIQGLSATRNTLRLEAGAQANIMPGGSLGVSYVGNLADRWSDHGLTLGFSYSF